MTEPAPTPFHEPLRTTLARTVAVAIVAGAIIASQWGGREFWPRATILAFWVSFGGHWVDLWFLNWLRPRLGGSRAARVAARLATWFAGGILLGAGMWATARFGFGVARDYTGAWWIAGLGFIGVELIAQGGLAIRGNSTFFGPRG